MAKVDNASQTNLQTNNTDRAYCEGGSGSGDGDGGQNGHKLYWKIKRNRKQMTFDRF